MRTFAIPCVDDGQHANALAMRQRISNNVHRPAFVCAVGRGHDHAQMTWPLLSPFQAKRQAFRSVQPLGALVVPDQAPPGAPSSRAVQSPAPRLPGAARANSLFPEKVLQSLDVQRLVFLFQLPQSSRFRHTVRTSLRSAGQ